MRGLFDAVRGDFNFSAEVSHKGAALHLDRSGKTDVGGAEGAAGDQQGRRRQRACGVWAGSVARQRPQTVLSGPLFGVVHINLVSSAAPCRLAR
jgi:hypothetical protein